MKVLMISGDKHMLTPGTEAYARAELQRAQVDQLDIFVWPKVHSLWQIFTAARRNRYDVVTAQDPFWRGHLAHHLVQLFGGRLNIQVHTDLSAYTTLKRLFARIQLRNADSIRVVSDNIKKQIESIGVRAKITVLPIFLDVSEFHSVIPRAHTSKNILWIGRFEEEKNPLKAIDVFKKVLEVEPAARLVMLGQGSLSQQISDQAANLPINVPGWQSPIIFLDTTDVVLCTSWHESWGASMIEALAAGVPVVAPDVGIAREAGAIVVERDKLADAVIAVLKNPPKAELTLSLLNKKEWAEAWRASL